MAGKKKQSEDRHQGIMVGLRMSQAESDALDEMAKKERRTKAAIIRWALYRYSLEQNHEWPEESIGDE